jgi:hypothetical protein
MHNGVTPFKRNKPLTLRAALFSRRQWPLSQMRNSTTFMEPEDSLPCSQELTSRPYCNPNESNTRPPTPYPFTIHFNIIFLSIAVDGGRVLFSREAASYPKRHAENLQTNLYLSHLRLFLLILKKVLLTFITNIWCIYFFPSVLIFCFWKSRRDRCLILPPCRRPCIRLGLHLHED